MSTRKKTVQDLLTYPDAGQLAVAVRLSGLAGLLAGLSAPTIDATPRVVAANTVSFVDSVGAAEYGIVQHVHVTTSGGGAGTGAYTVILDGAPASGEVLLEYTSGQPVLTFNATDVVTACVAHWINTGSVNGNSLAANLATEVGVG